MDEDMTEKLLSETGESPSLVDLKIQVPAGALYRLPALFLDYCP